MDEADPEDNQQEDGKDDIPEVNPIPLLLAMAVAKYATIAAMLPTTPLGTRDIFLTASHFKRWQLKESEGS